MEISQDTLNVVEFLNSIIVGGLRKKNDITAIFELSASYSNADILNDLILNATALSYLEKKLKNFQNSDKVILSSNHAENIINNIKKEVIALTEEFCQRLKELIDLSENSELIERFEKIYFSMSEGALLNILDLAYDLTNFKELQNNMKNQQGKDL